MHETRLVHQLAKSFTVRNEMKMMNKVNEDQQQRHAG